MSMTVTIDQNFSTAIVLFFAIAIPTVRYYLDKTLSKAYDVSEAMVQKMNNITEAVASVVDYIPKNSDDIKKTVTNAATTIGALPFPGVINTFPKTSYLFSKIQDTFSKPEPASYALQLHSNNNISDTTHALSLIYQCVEPCVAIILLYFVYKKLSAYFTNNTDKTSDNEQDVYNSSASRPIPTHHNSFTIGNAMSSDDYNHNSPYNNIHPSTMPYSYYLG